VVLGANNAGCRRLEATLQVLPSNLGTRNLFCYFFLRSDTQTTNNQNIAGTKFQTLKVWRIENVRFFLISPDSAKKQVLGGQATIFKILLWRSCVPPISLCGMRRLLDQASMSCARHRCPVDKASMSRWWKVDRPWGSTHCQMRTQVPDSKKHTKIGLKVFPPGVQGLALFFFVPLAPHHLSWLSICSRGTVTLKNPLYCGPGNTIPLSTKNCKKLIKYMAHHIEPTNRLHQCTCNPPTRLNLLPAKTSLFYVETHKKTTSLGTGVHDLTKQNMSWRGSFRTLIVSGFCTGSKTGSKLAENRIENVPLTTSDGNSIFFSAKRASGRFAKATVT